MLSLDNLIETVVDDVLSASTELLWDEISLGCEENVKTSKGKLYQASTDSRFIPRSNLVPSVEQLTISHY